VHVNEEQIRRLYSAFARRDAAAMAAHYAPDAVFSDPAFGELHGPQIGAMWAMLTSRAVDLLVEMTDSDADRAKGSGRWEAWYTFTSTGRQVHNVVHTTFRFRDGLIVEQHDHFAFWPWSRQALGMMGLLLGWTPFVKAKVRRNARKGLDAFMARPQKPAGATAASAAD
jgi:ketosteroid isomerase-like protein